MSGRPSDQRRQAPPRRAPKRAARSGEWQSLNANKSRDKPAKAPVVYDPNGHPWAPLGEAILRPLPRAVQTQLRGSWNGFTAVVDRLFNGA